MLLIIKDQKKFNILQEKTEEGKFKSYLDTICADFAVKKNIGKEVSA